MSQPDQLVRLNTAARELGLSPATVKKYCRCGYLQCQQLPSGHWRVYRGSLNAAIENTNRTKPTHTESNP